MTFQPFCSSRGEFSCRLVKAAWDALQTHRKSSWYNGKAQAYKLTLPAAKLERDCLSQHFTALTSQRGLLPALRLVRVYFGGALRLVVLHRIFDTIRNSLLLPTVMKLKTIYSSLELALRQLLRELMKLSLLLTSTLFSLIFHKILLFLGKNIPQIFLLICGKKYPTDMVTTDMTATNPRYSIYNALHKSASAVFTAQVRTCQW